MRYRFALVVIAACYREQAVTEPMTNAGRPLELQPGKLVCDRDDGLQLVVETGIKGRLRSQISGNLSRWAPPSGPTFIPSHVESLDLFLIDEADGGYLAFYRERYGGKSCKLSGDRNCAYEARFYDKRGLMRWNLPFDEVLSRKSHLEVQDIRYAGGVLYFNEACQSYAKEAKNRCSSLVAVDPQTQRVLWRTPNLTSNGRFTLRGCYVVAGYGFTNEPDSVHVVDRGSGKVMQRIDVASAPQEYTVDENEIEIELYSGQQHRYRMVDFTGRNGRLVSTDREVRAGYGGATYGGATYGGATYGP